MRLCGLDPFSDAGPTLLIDEADTFLSGNSVMRGILNCGNTWRTAYVLRLSSRKGRRKSGEAKQEDSNAVQSLGSNLVRYSCCNELLLAQALRSYGIRPGTIRIGEEVNKGYRVDDFKECLRRYVSRVEIDARLKEIGEKAQLLEEARAEEAARRKTVAKEFARAMEQERERAGGRPQA